MASRLKLQSELETLLGTNKVYFQPPETTKFEYPCIVYEFDDAEAFYADNRIYTKTKRYSVTYMSYDPDDVLVDTMLDSFEMISFDRRFVSDNLYHNTFRLFY